MIAIVACCDTKYHEIAFVQESIRQTGHLPLTLDISTGPASSMTGDITRENILSLGGFTVEQVCAFAKSEALAAMSESVGHMLLKLYSSGEISGVFGMGGLQNTVVCSAAFQRLPLGFPKMIASTIASGFRYFDTVVGDKDITVVPSIVDFAGMNPVSEVVLRNAIAALVGMVEHGGGTLNTAGRFLIGATLMGITNDTVMSVSDQLMARGREIISFHSTGLGGRVMEQMIRDGHIKAVMDLTLHEMTAEYFGGYGYSKGADHRLCAAAEMGIPMLVCPGGIDFICLQKNELFPDEEKRGFVWHNHELTHTRLYEKEILDITHTIVHRVNQTSGKATVVLPLGGLRTLSRPGEPFHKPEIILAMQEIFKTELDPKVRFISSDYNYMDQKFSTLLLAEMLKLLDGEGC